MLLRDELFLQAGYQKELTQLLETACQQEALCRLMYTPPGQMNMLVEIGHIQELTDHWLILDTYKLPTSAAGPNVLNQSTLHLPTKSIIGIELGNHPELIVVQELLEEQRSRMRTSYGMSPDAASGHLPEAWQQEGQAARYVDHLADKPGFFKRLQFLSQRLLKHS